MIIAIPFKFQIMHRKSRIEVLLVNTRPDGKLYDKHAHKLMKFSQCNEQQNALQ